MREFIGLVAAYFAIVRGPFTNPDLGVGYQVNKMQPPRAAMRLADSLARRDTSRAELLRQLLKPAIADYTVEVIVMNLTDDVIRDVDLRVAGISYLGDVSASSENTRLAVESALNATVYRNGEVVIGAIPQLPPKAVLRVLLWVDLDDRDAGPTVTATASTKSVQVMHLARSTPGAQFLAQNAFELCALLGAVSLLVGLRRVSRQP